MRKIDAFEETRLPECTVVDTKKKIAMSKILIVDNSPDLLEMMEHILNYKGYKVKS